LQPQPRRAGSRKEHECPKSLDGHSSRSFPFASQRCCVKTRPIEGSPVEKSGENVTTSEVAKQLLESAREDRLEVAELLANATVALAAARRKAEAGLSLARAEWIVLAYYVQLGVESHIGVLISPETMKGILEAFLAAYRVRRGKKSSQDTHYLSNLPVLDKEGKPVFGAEAEGIDVLTAVERLIRKIDGPRDEEIWPQFARGISTSFWRMNPSESKR